jgi:prepilin-type N-terminal cleavage/methylation domain-containing protein
MNSKLNTRGFTLIELLVVIAIIGILASVVLASLNSARDKGSDAAVKGGLSQIRAQAELFYDAGRTYAGFCTNATTTPILTNIQSNSVNGATLVTTYATAGAASQVTCHDIAGSYAVIAPLKGTSGSFMCVDSAGFSNVTATNLGANDTVCN